VHLAAFPTALEADLVDRLRGDADWLISVVAEERTEKNPPIAMGGLRGPRIGDGVVGHILVTRIRIDGIEDAVFGAIAPVAVPPEFQRRGIGSAIIRRALEDARAMGLGAVFVLGDPAYYARFGFRRADEYGIRCAWDGTEDAFRVVELVDGVLRTRDLSPGRHSDRPLPQGERLRADADGARAPVRVARYHEAFSACE